MSNYIITIKKKAAKKVMRNISLSDILPPGFQESVLTLEAQIIRDDAYSIIQSALLGGYVNLLWDKAVSLSNTLLIESNTNITAISGKGAVLKNSVNKPMMRNRTLRFSDNNSIIDRNIVIDGGIWNGNSAGQTVKGTSQFGFANLFSWYGVENLTLKNHKMYTPKVYAQHAINVVNGHISDFVVDVGTNPAINMDGVHWDGWCKNCSIKDGNIRSYDDGIGINADDLLNVSTSEAKGFFPVSANGPVENIVIENIVFNDSLFGIRLLSGQSKISNIIIKNISGITKNYSIIVDNYWQNPNGLDKPGKGNIENITVESVTTTVPSSSVAFPINRAKIVLSCSIKDLTMTGVTPTGTNLPILEKLSQSSDGQYTYSYDNVKLNGNPV
ncbi:hypothetical protein C1637_09995 [Chryseobacterium lactis]|uniref:Uncharacterized protein n=1 Tax=Chryseobacterium lactis TaxID=1241981 RepID=A0A3G6REM3_CHRLC|nr:hypothetical protein [Chryseobacterium lactis]AZA82157.1 hypothetical protein EG342_09700 [Chryseobacterium lactis]AZB02538.1 hypothetical protein EG341_00555 [Chryseobacterium lactis]PNW14166.1 hypothetical protein C1637_09995 [Chryseobacterium lactis]